jgi:hypothetical protein
MSLLKKIELVLLTSVVLGAPVSGYGEVLFEENFNEQDDWTSTMHTTRQSQQVAEGAILPQSWDAIYQGTVWSPETGFPNNHASLEILASNASKARTKTGKSAVFWRESYSRGWNNWASDAQLVKVFDRNFDQLYVEFWIRFSDTWYGRQPGEEGPWTSKIFRIGSWDRQGDMFNGAAGSLGPVFFWDWKRDAYGVRNLFTYRGGPHGENYKMLNINGERIYRSGESLNFAYQTAGMGEGGTDPKLPDRVKAKDGVKDNGPYLIDVPGGVLDHDQVFGQGAAWTKMAFFVKMNSAPGVHDGIVRQWINGVQVHNRVDVPWISKNKNNEMVGWNYIAIGGNDFFQAYANSKHYEDWYSIDDVIVRNDIPSDLGAGDIPVPPGPPMSVNIK